MILSLAACQVDNTDESDNDENNSSDTPITDEQKINNVLDRLEIPATINQNIELVNTVDDITITWESSDPYYLSTEGIYNQPLFRSGEKEIILTAH
ncbi:MAG: immunoglobulin-like domain-containing protein, partial [Bacillota bacterium]